MSYIRLPLASLNLANNRLLRPLWAVIPSCNPILAFSAEEPLPATTWLTLKTSCQYRTITLYSGNPSFPEDCELIDRIPIDGCTEGRATSLSENMELTCDEKGLLSIIIELKEDSKEYGHFDAIKPEEYIFALFNQGDRVFEVSEQLIAHGMGAKLARKTALLLREEWKIRLEIDSTDEKAAISSDKTKAGLLSDWNTFTTKLESCMASAVYSGTVAVIWLISSLYMQKDFPIFGLIVILSSCIGFIACSSCLSKRNKIPLIVYSVGLALVTNWIIGLCRFLYVNNHIFTSIYSAAGNLSSSGTNNSGASEILSSILNLAIPSGTLIFFIVIGAIAVMIFPDFSSNSNQN